MRFSFEHGGTSGDFSVAEETLKPYFSDLKKIKENRAYGEPESFIRLPSDGEIASSVKLIYNEKAKRPLRFAAVLGIGGSNLGAKAVYDAILGFKDSVDSSDRPRVLFFDTVGERSSGEAAEHILNHSESEEDFILMVISKSGVTTETIAETEFLLSKLKKKFPEAEKRMVVVTDEDSPLYESASARGISVLPIPKQVGGRYSVFSAAGLLPLAVSGLDVRAFCDGASQMTEKCLSARQDNPALLGAAFLSKWRTEGKTIHDIFLFAPELESLGKWYRQLLSESIGKTEKSGITPTVSVGSTDLHSAGELVLDGPKDKTALFVSVSGGGEAGVPKEERAFPEINSPLSGRSLSGIMSAILNGAKSAYVKAGIPFAEAELEELNEREIGAFMQWKMIETALLGKLFSVNAFNQPAVESFKKEAEKFLKETDK